MLVGYSALTTAVPCTAVGGDAGLSVIFVSGLVTKVWQALTTKGCLLFLGFIFSHEFSVIFLNAYNFHIFSGIYCMPSLLTNLPVMIIL